MSYQDDMINELKDQIEALTAKLAEKQALLDEWGIEGGPPIKMGAHTLDHPYHTVSGDTFNLSVKDAGGETNLLTADIKETMKIDHVSIYRFTDALGYNHAVMGVFGNQLPAKK